MTHKNCCGETSKQSTTLKSIILEILLEELSNNHRSKNPAEYITAYEGRSHLMYYVCMCTHDNIYHLNVVGQNIKNSVDQMVKLRLCTPK